MLYTEEQLIYDLKIKSEKIHDFDVQSEMNKFTKIKDGLYTDDEEPDPRTLANTLVIPSYISFNTALSYHDMIPEQVFAMTSATLRNEGPEFFEFKSERYLYCNVPPEAYHIGVYFETVDSGDSYWIATKEKALCDKLAHIEERENLSEMEDLILDDLRINEYRLDEIDYELICEIESHYHCKNITLFKEWIKGWLDEGPHCTIYVPEKYE